MSTPHEDPAAASQQPGWPAGYPSAGFGPGSYGQPGNPRYPGNPGNPGGWVAPLRTGTNGLAIASLVLSIVTLYGVGSLLGIVFGLIARRQTRDTGQSGAGLALAGVIVGTVTLLLCVWFWSELISHHGHYCAGIGTSCKDGGYGD
jgi:hypothetical protein